jgi:nitrite reductase (NADH) small subunit
MNARSQNTNGPQGRKNRRGKNVCMPFVKVGALAALPPGQVMEAEVGGNTYVVCNAGGELYAYDGVCPHAGGPLGQGALDGNILVCPWHAWEYDCRTGVNDYDESVTLTPFPVKSQDGEILIDVP